jgi:hypothetical protein
MLSATKVEFAGHRPVLPAAGIQHFEITSKIMVTPSSEAAEIPRA